MGSEKGRKVGLTRPSGLKLLSGTVIVSVMVVVIVGLYLAGSPENARSDQLDQRRLSDLQSISNSVQYFYNQHERLPENLLELANDARIEVPTDPEDHDNYDYQPDEGASYELCATFSSSGPERGERPMPVYPVREKNIWIYEAGENCFELNARSFNFYCDAVTRCPPGLDCLKLPQASSPVCLAREEACAAAGCPDCQVLESYPLRVTCPTNTEEPASCELMQDTATGQVSCLECLGSCDYPTGWISYYPPTDPEIVSIPYACYRAPAGECALAQ